MQNEKHVSGNQGLGVIKPAGLIWNYGKCLSFLTAKVNGGNTLRGDSLREAR